RDPVFAVGELDVVDEPEHSSDGGTFREPERGLLSDVSPPAGSEVDVGRYRTADKLAAFLILHDPGKIHIADRVRGTVSNVELGGPGFVPGDLGRTVKSLDGRFRHLQECELDLALRVGIRATPTHH